MHEEILAEKKLFNETREALNIKFHEERQSFEKYFTLKFEDTFMQKFEDNQLQIVWLEKMIQRE